MPSHWNSVQTPVRSHNFLSTPSFIDEHLIVLKHTHISLFQFHKKNKNKICIHKIIYNENQVARIWNCLNERQF